MLGGGLPCLALSVCATVHERVKGCFKDVKGCYRKFRELDAGCHLLNILMHFIYNKACIMK